MTGQRKNILEKLRGLNEKQKAVVSLCLILPAPLMGITASLYFPHFGDVQIGQAIWLLMKVWLIAMPVLWLLYIDTGRLSWSPTTLKGVLAGLLWAIRFQIWHTASCQSCGHITLLL